MNFIFNNNNLKKEESLNQNSMKKENMIENNNKINKFKEENKNPELNISIKEKKLII